MKDTLIGLLRWVLIGTMLAGLCGAGIAYYAYDRVLRIPRDGPEAVAILHVPPGTRLKSVLRKLGDQGVLSWPEALYVYARLRGLTEIRTGEYEFRSEQSPLEILSALNAGRVRLHQFTLAEGLNRWQVRDILVGDGWMDAATFDRLCDDAAFLKEHAIPGPTCDGYLFPETYSFARGVTPQTLFKTLLTTYKQQLHAIAKGNRYGPLGLSEREFVTLASIVEKETGAPEERPRIACVFYNRLRAKPAWRLQTDPTVIYAATLEDPKFDGNITRAHLHDLDNPYNTYRVYGLPPGPIASPGRESFAAVQKPASCADFFFVSMNNGQHKFCPTLDCHNRAVDKWQIKYFHGRRP